MVGVTGGQEFALSQEPASAGFDKQRGNRAEGRRRLRVV
jgi:hypothetical protein